MNNFSLDPSMTAAIGGAFYPDGYSFVMFESAEDAKKVELVQARNQADGLIHATRNAITEHGSKVDGSVIGNVESALADLETAMKGDDKGQIEAKTKNLEEAGQSLYAAAAAGSSQAGDPGAGPQSDAAEDVVDAEFTEVKEEDEKK